LYYSETTLLHVSDVSTFASLLPRFLQHLCPLSTDDFAAVRLDVLRSSFFVVARPSSMATNRLDETISVSLQHRCYLFASRDWQSSAHSHWWVFLCCPLSRGMPKQAMASIRHHGSSRLPKPVLQGSPSRVEVFILLRTSVIDVLEHNSTPGFQEMIGDARGASVICATERIIHGTQYTVHCIICAVDATGPDREGPRIYPCPTFCHHAPVVVS
jgi:hypothetical protein